MNKKDLIIRYATLVATLASAVFIFFNWFTVSLPALNTFLTSGEMHLSFVSLPGFIQENAVGLITRMGGKSTAVTLLLLCGVLKYVCIVSAIFGLYGIWKVCIQRRKSRFIFSAQIIAIAIEAFALLLIVIINIVLSNYAGVFANAMRVQESLIDISFLPTVWMLLSIASSVGSLLLSNMYNKILSKEE